MNKNSKILTGCGIGCGTVAIILIVIGVIGYNFFSEKVEEIKKFSEIISNLEDQYEDYNNFTPSENDLFSESRMEIFLEIRDSIKAKTPAFTSALRKISHKIEDSTRNNEDNQSFSGVLDMVNTGFSAIPEIANYFTYRHKLLEKYKMAIGEYYYYFLMSYYVALDTDMGDGPNFPVPGNSDGTSYNYSNKNYSDSEEFINELREKRIDRIKIKVNNFMLSVFQNYLAKKNTKHKKIIMRQIKLMEKDKYELPFSDSKPVFFTIFFEKYSNRLKNNYVEILNPLEINPVKPHKRKKHKKNQETLIKSKN